MAKHRNRHQAVGVGMNEFIDHVAVQLAFIDGMESGAVAPVSESERQQIEHCWENGVSVDAAAESVRW